MQLEHGVKWFTVEEFAKAAADGYAAALQQCRPPAGFDASESRWSDPENFTFEALFATVSNLAVLAEERRVPFNVGVEGGGCAATIYCGPESDFTVVGAGMSACGCPAPDSVKP